MSRDAALTQTTSGWWEVELFEPTEMPSGEIRMKGHSYPITAAKRDELYADDEEAVAHAKASIPPEHWQLVNAVVETARKRAAVHAYCCPDPGPLRDYLDTPSEALRP